uniref:Uncharacterized protein n=1 Tax=Tanacetum cinerariifolium TaxID=118510 RepID=A0A6L2LGL9_TANCI|nr:hypothetical protein [Tanacetum cinerariifolium]
MSSVSHIFVLSCFDDDESTRSSIPCIIQTDSEDEDANFPAVPPSLSPDYVLALPDYTLNFDLDFEPFKEDPQEADLKAYSKEEPTEDDTSDEDSMDADEPLQA